jgi:hypothetical protein
MPLGRLLDAACYHQHDLVPEKINSSPLSLKAALASRWRIEAITAHYGGCRHGRHPPVFRRSQDIEAMLLDDLQKSQSHTPPSFAPVSNFFDADG